MASLLLLIFLIMIHKFCVSGVSSAYWSVSYSHSDICALKGSTVTIYCTYTYPTGHQIQEMFWTTGPKMHSEKTPDLSEDPEYSQRLQYLGDKQNNCTIRLSHVTQKDEHMYYFRFITDIDKWTGYPGVNLTVTDLQVDSPETVKEGDSVRLTCKSSCALTERATFIWYRNSQPLTERRDRNNQLLLQSVRREDAGRYSCALQGHKLTSAFSAYLSVMYPPKHTFVAVSPCCELVEGNSVTLSCNCDSYPPALNFSWFKGGTFVGSGRIYSISKISSNHSGEYKCKSVTEHGEAYSDAVNLNVICVGCPVILYIFIGVFIGAAVVIMVVLIWVKKRKDAQESQMNLSRPHHNICQMSDVKMMDTVYENEMAKQDEEEKRHTGVSAKMNQSKAYHNIYQTSDEKLPESVYEDVTMT
ncbi:B-cell receptor CD22 isoform X1 [Carassius gibelio]|uniref:B-cell receptor CD22 isoform X1 n=1 Tax=Carassius gibelio TaxID=101364 RepID=UPI002277F4F8|nr:B-cell receptor CD22 isoform X1 [Carassius gibelio]